jgi:hypothetical protein
LKRVGRIARVEVHSLMTNLISSVEFNLMADNCSSHLSH